MNATDIPRWQGISDTASATPITFEMMERQYNYLRSDEYARDLEVRRQQFEAEQRARWERIERWWLRTHATTVMTEELRSELLDLWRKFMCEHTNILEVLS